MQQVTEASKKHSLSLSDRTALAVTGVEDVLGFDEAVITCRTTLGELIIEGSSLHIQSFSAEKGELAVEGKLSALYYDEGREKGGALRRLFRK
ncbi:MAG: sporulation protein [Clostridia bacterium]|nr:sporulation protein [Clostridia bacterium]